MSIDLFDSRVLLMALEKVPQVRTFFRDTFFGGAPQVSQTKYVDIDIHKGARRLAPFVAPMQQGKVVERLGFTTNTYEPPYIKPKMVFTAADILKRPMGTHIYQGAAVDPATQAMQQAQKDLRDLSDMITRRIEWMCAQLVLAGSVTCTGEGGSWVVNFGRSAGNTITLSGGDLWSEYNNAESNPLKDLRAWSRIINKGAFVPATDIIMSANVIDVFLDHPLVKDKLDMRAAELLSVNPAYNFESGVTYYGRIKDVGCDLWTYDEWYLDPTTGTETAMIPDNKVIMASRRARNVMHYGAIQDLDCMAVVPMFPKAWSEKDPSANLLMLQSAPLPCTHDVDAFVVATVL